MMSSSLPAAFCYSSYQISISVEVRDVPCGVHSLAVRLWESLCPPEGRASRRIRMAIIPHTASYPTSAWPSALCVRRYTARETVIPSTIDKHAWSENGLKMVKFPSSLRTAVGCIFSAERGRQRQSCNQNHGGFIMQTIIRRTVLVLLNPRH